MLADLMFVDLYLGSAYLGLKDEAGRFCDVPSDWVSAAQALRARCETRYRQHQEPEFSLIDEGIVFRVTALTDVSDDTVFVLRRSKAQLRAFATLGFSEPAKQVLLAKSTQGLVVIAGKMGHGKTSTAASLMKERLSLYGGVGIAIEDPPETTLEGRHGEGRCIQVRASRRHGGYREPIILAMRSSADVMLIGEIRDEGAAIEALKASINGHLVITTVHAGDIIQAIERLYMLSQGVSDGLAMLADGLTLVAYQRLDHVPRQGGSGLDTRCVIRTLLVQGDNNLGTRNKIRQGNFSHLVQDIEQQRLQTVWR